MSRALEFAAATGAALVLHFAAFGFVAERLGVSGAGAGGQALASLDAAPAALSALVEAWDTPPETALPASAALPLPEGLAPQPVLPRATEAPVPLPRIAALSPPASDSAATQPEHTARPPESTAPRLAALAPTPPAAPSAAPIAHPPGAAAPARPQPPTADIAPIAAEPATETAVAQYAPQTSPQTSPRPQPRPGTARPAQRAEGSGGAGAAGTAGQAEAASADQARNGSAMAAWGAGIRARIEARQRFPAVAPGLHGNVTIDLAVARSGSLAAVTIVASSGNPAFDAAALAAARAASPFAPAPAALSSPQYSFRLVIRFRR